MLKIGVVSQKGGVGKSTIARDLARCFAFADWKVKIADLDFKQTTSTDWSRRRMSAGLQPYVAVEQFPTLKAALGVTGVHLLIIDAKPHSSDETREIGLAADLVVIPTGTTLDDLEPQVRLAHELKRAKVDPQRIVFVLNSVNKNRDATDAQRAIAYI
jgi:chromosome partitioning protein